MSSVSTASSVFPARFGRLTRFAKVAGQRLSLLAIFLILWWLAAQRVPAFILPGPGKTWNALLELIATGTFAEDLGITLYRVVAGFLLAALVGTPLGILLGSNRRLGSFCEPVLSVVNTVSAAIWAIFALIWFGISNGTTIFVVFMEAMPLILTNVWQGAQSVNAEYVELARSFQMSRGKVMTQDLSAHRAAVLLLRCAPCVRLRLAGVAGGGDDRFVERRRLPAASGGGPCSDRSGVRMDAHDGRADGGARIRHSQAARKPSVPLEEASLKNGSRRIDAVPRAED